MLDSKPEKHNKVSSSESSCGIVLPYRELDWNSLSEAELPPPQYYRRTKKSSKITGSSNTTEAKPPSLVLSLLKPHKILLASKEMCDLLGYGEAEMRGRSLNMLQGPKTNASALSAAIKNTGLMSTVQLSTSLYTIDGSERPVFAICVPYLSEYGELAGCKLQTTPANDISSEDITEK